MTSDNIKSILGRLNQVKYWVSFSHNRIEVVLNDLEKNNPKLIDEVIVPIGTKSLANYHSLVGILLMSAIDKLDGKLVRNMKESEFRTKLAAAITKDEKIKAIFDKEKITASQILAPKASQVKFDPIAAVRIGIDLITLESKKEK